MESIQGEFHRHVQVEACKTKYFVFPHSIRYCFKKETNDIFMFSTAVTCERDAV
jgi:hypothetical protein